jgi:hypothetical protein
MKRFLSLGISMVVVIMIFLGGSAIAGEKVQLCHVPPGNPGNWHTITVNENAVQSHLAHGDLMGSCDDPTNCAMRCDDGNPCTIDACDSSGECAPKQPVDCDDTRNCTADFCDTSSGCRYVEDCEGFGECGFDTGECTVCPQEIRENITMVLSAIIAQKHNPPDPVPPDNIGGYDSLRYDCENLGYLYFKIVAAAGNTLSLSSIGLPVQIRTQGQVWIEINPSSSMVINGWTISYFNSDMTPPVYTLAWYPDTQDDSLTPEEAYVCMSWAAREVEAITGQKCELDPPLSQ